MPIRFFHSTSYSTHADVVEAKQISQEQYVGQRAYFEQYHDVAFDMQDLFKSRKALAVSVKFYSARLANRDPVSFGNIINQSDRIACEEELLHTFYILSAQYQLLMFEGDDDEAKELAKQRSRCEQLLFTLNNIPWFGDKKLPEQAHQEQMNTSLGQPAAYIGLTIYAALIADTMLSFITPERLKSARQETYDKNYVRLLWVWTSGFARTILELLPKGVGNKQQASSAFSIIAPVTGYISWVLYYTRLGLELSLLTRGSLKGSWMDPWNRRGERTDPGILERFLTQWELRKFKLLNDVFWATANLACFFWLVGSGTLGYLGNALTGVLLVFDLSLTAWGWHERECDHKDLLRQFDKDINALTGKLDKEKDESRIKVLEQELSVLIGARNQCELDWQYADKQWRQDAWYAVGLFAAFSMLCCFFFPPAAILPATALILGVVGSAIALLLTIGSHSLATSNEIEKLKVIVGRDEKKLETLKARKKGEESGAMLKSLNLEIKHLKADLDYQKKMIAWHKTEIIQQTLSEAMLPAATFSILVFMPMGLGLPVLLPTVALLMMSGRLLPAKPKKPGLEDDLALVPSPGC